MHADCRILKTSTKPKTNVTFPKSDSVLERDPKTSTNGHGYPRNIGEPRHEYRRKVTPYFAVECQPSRNQNHSINKNNGKADIQGKDVIEDAKRSHLKNNHRCTIGMYKQPCDQQHIEQWM